MTDAVTVFGRFAATARRRGGATAVVTEHESRSWAELLDQVEACAGHLHRAGVEAGERVATIFENEPHFLVVWLALARLGAVNVPINPALAGTSLRVVLEDCGTTRIVTSRERIDHDGDDATLDGRLEHLVPVTVPGGDAPPFSPDPAAPAAVLYTSGTTGRPKGVVLSHRSYLSAGRRMVDAVEIDEQDRILVVLPLFHANPQFYALMAAVTTGASLALAERFSASRFWEVADRLAATGFTYVGTVLSILQGTSPPTEHRLRWCTGGGAPPGTWDTIEDEFGIRVHELYGMTETGGFATITTRSASRRGACGQARPDVELAILDEHDHELAPQQVGQICLRAHEPGVLFDGYLGQPRVTRERWRGGWFHTGDTGYVDEDGFLYFLGRTDHVIRRGGENIAPAQVEDALVRHPQVAEVAVVGVPHSTLGQEVKAIVVPTDPALDVRQLPSWLRRDLPPAAVPRYYLTVPSLPKTPTEKVRVDRLHELEGETYDADEERDQHG